MTCLHYMVISLLVVGLLNLFAILFLSNAIFRILISRSVQTARRPSEVEGGGLIDIKQSMTYDPRFEPKKQK